MDSLGLQTRRRRRSRSLDSMDSRLPAAGGPRIRLRRTIVRTRKGRGLDAKRTSSSPADYDADSENNVSKMFPFCN